MKISWSWLSSLIDTDGLDPHEAAERLTLSGMEVEAVAPFGVNPDFDTVVVGHILSIEPHPKADKLVVCQVSTGAPEPRQIVCGATNMKAGDKVPVALPGTVMGEDFTIGVSKLRGVRSEGMMCSAKELGLGHDHAGLMILPQALPLGEPVFEAMALADTVLEIGLTPNRPDGLSHVGVARELAALTGRALRLPALLEGWRAASRGQDPGAGALDGTWGAAAGQTPTADLLTVRLDDAEGCPRYAAAVLEGVTVGPSPAWLRARLMAIGQRPINNLVDVTNYVLHECGQPLHAFDLDTLAGATLVIRRAQDGESIVTIDDTERALTSEDVVIADANGPVAVAGVMGGAHSGVTAQTTRVVIECAYFQPPRVRRTGRRLGLHTESSHRFERGIDPNGAPWFLRRAVELIVQTQAALGAAPPTLAPAPIDLYPAPVTPETVSLTCAHYARIIGTTPSAQEMADVLDRLDLTAQVDGDTLHVRVPTFRPDIARPVDLIEEVARVLGFDALPPALPSGLMGFAHVARTDPQASSIDTLVPVQDEAALDRARRLLLDHGLREAINYTFVSAAAIGKLGFDEGDVRSHPVRLRNPIADDMDVMRTSLIPGLMANLAHNRAHQRADVAMFEVGRVYLRADMGTAPLPERVGGQRWGTHAEPVLAAALVTGAATQHFTGDRPWTLHDLRGVAEDLVAALTRHPLRVAPFERPPLALHPYACGRLIVAGVEVGWIASLHPDYAADGNVKAPVHGFSIDLSRLLTLRADAPRFQAIARYPASQRDFALSVAADLPYDALDQAIASFGEPRLIQHRLFDVYEGEQIEQGRKSWAINVTFQDASGTLSEDDLTSLQTRLVEHLSATLGAVQR